LTIGRPDRAELIQEPIDVEEVLLRFLSSEQDHKRDASLRGRQCPIWPVVATSGYRDEPELEDVGKEQQERALAGDLEGHFTDHPVRK